MSRIDAVASAGGEDFLDEDAVDSLEHVRRLGRLLDESIRLPGGYRIGIDPVVGLLPVVGDVPASAVSVYIVVEAAYLGVPRATLARMIVNVVVDTVFGSVPVVGPLFDAVWKANVRNVALLEDRLDEPAAARTDRRVLAALAVTLVGLVVGLGVAVAAAVAWLVARLGGI